MFPSCGGGSCTGCVSKVPLNEADRNCVLRQTRKPCHGYLRMKSEINTTQCRRDLVLCLTRHHCHGGRIVSSTKRTSRALARVALLTFSLLCSLDNAKASAARTKRMGISICNKNVWLPLLFKPLQLEAPKKLQGNPHAQAT